MPSQWIQRQLDGARLSDTSRAQYMGSLEYWSAWHQLRYEGRQLSLLDSPARAVETSVLTDFADDHRPLTRGGIVVCGMEQRVWNGLLRLGFNTRITCPSQATTKLRFRALKSIHDLAGLFIDAQAISRIVSSLRIQWDVINATPETIGGIRSITTLVTLLRGACPDTRDGIRAAAVVTLLKLLTPAQLARLQFGDLVPGYVNLPDRQVRVVEVCIRAPVNEFQRLFSRPRLLDLDAETVVLWGAVRVYDELGEGEEHANPDWPFIIRDMRNGSSAPVPPRWVAEQVRSLWFVARGSRRRNAASVIRLWAQRESENQQNLALIARNAGLKRQCSAERLIRRRKSE